MFKNMGLSELCKELEPYDFDSTVQDEHERIYQGTVNALVLHPDERIYLVRLLQAANLMSDVEPVGIIWGGMYLMVDLRVPKGKILVVSTVMDRCRDLKVISDLANQALEHGNALDFDRGRAGFIDIR